MTEANTPSPDEDRELIERLRWLCAAKGRQESGRAADRLESLLADRLEQDATIRLQAQRLMELSSEIVQLREAVLNRSTDRAT